MGACGIAGELPIADDVGNTIWRVTPAAKSAARQGPPPFR
jgi:hypothetical protein